MTYEELRETVELAEAKLGEKLVLYYIGNCSSAHRPDDPQWYPGNYDDRSWGISFEERRLASADRNHYAPHNLILGSTKDALRWTREALIMQLEARQTRLGGKPLKRGVDACERCGRELHTGLPTPCHRCTA